MSAKGLWFVYRSHHAGPLSRRLCRIDAASILAWFQEKLADARGSATPREVADADLGGSVCGFGSLLDAAKEHKLAPPKSTAALRAMLQKHLRVEGGPDNIRLDDHTLRVLTDDDEVQLAYYFFDDDAAREHAERIAWLLEEDPRVIDGDDDGDFEPPVSVQEFSPGKGTGATYACLFTSYDARSLPGNAVVFPGVRLPGLAGHLRRVVPPAEPQSWSADWLDTWPVELRLLRAMVEPGERTLAPALARCAEYPLRALRGRGNHTRLGIGPHAEARPEFMAAADGLAQEGDPGASIVHEGEHVAILCAHVSRRLGYQQWVFFDDRWAAASPDLGASMLRCARDWDPFPWEPPRRRSADELAAARQESAWDDAITGRAGKEARRYRPGDRFAAGELIEHAKFGLGVVRRAEATKIEVVFRDATRTLAHGIG